MTELPYDDRSDFEDADRGLGALVRGDPAVDLTRTVSEPCCSACSPAGASPASRAPPGPGFAIVTP
jgi:hypothetical protein